MPHSFWGEAISTVVYVLNKSSTKKLEEKVPEENWYGRKPTVNHLRIFGSLCYKHVPNAKRRKLQDKSECMILVGYHSIGAYRLYDPIKAEICISRDVIVNEAESWD